VDREPAGWQKGHAVSAASLAIALTCREARYAGRLRLHGSARGSALRALVHAGISRDAPGLQHGQSSAGVQTDRAADTEKIDVPAQHKQRVRGVHDLSFTCAGAACPAAPRRTGFPGGARVAGGIIGDCSCRRRA